MRMLVFGAAGPTGRAVVDEALAAGHDVTIVVAAGVRTPGPHERLEVVEGDGTDPAVVDKAVLGKDVVVAAGEATNRRTSTRCSDTIGTVIAALAEAGGPQRVVCVSSARTNSKGMPLGRRIYQDLIIHRRHHNPINDMMRMEDELRRTDLDWTVLHPTLLTDGPATGRYRTARSGKVPGGRRLSRGDLGHFVAHRLDDPATHRTTVEISY